MDYRPITPTRTCSRPRLLPIAVVFALMQFWPAAGPAIAQDDAGPYSEIESKYLFGFTTGSDIGLEGEREVSAETRGRLGKRDGSFRALEHRLEFEATPTQFLQFEMSVLGTTHHIQGVTGLDDRDRSAFEGVSGEARYLVVGRGPSSPFGLTLSFEPTLAHIDDTTGERLRRLETEFKAAADTELVPNRVFLAFNALFEPEWIHPRFNPSAREAGIGASTALAFRATPQVAIGGELRYLRKYQGIELQRLEGDALYVGPTLYVQLSKKAFLAGGWLTQIAGHEAVDRRERAAAVFAAIDAGDDPLSAVPTSHHKFNLRDFDRHLAKLKLGIEF